MNLALERDLNSPSDATMGALYVDGQFECFTLELPWKENQHDVSCIPVGSYNVIISYSLHLGFDTPEVTDVTDRAGIRIHPANKVSQIKGCIAVGNERQGDQVIHSNDAFTVLLGKIRQALDGGEKVTLRIEDNQ